MVVGNEMTQPLTLHSYTHTRFIWLLPACCYSIYYTYFDFHAAHTQHTHIAPQQHVHPHYLETFVVQTIVVCNEFWVRAVRKMFLGARICNAFRHIHKPCLIIQNIFIVIIIVQCTDLQTSNRNKVYGFILVVCVCTWWADILYLSFQMQFYTSILCLLLYSICYLSGWCFMHACRCRWKRLIRNSRSQQYALARFSNEPAHLAQNKRRYRLWNCLLRAKEVFCWILTLFKHPIGAICA